MVMNKCSKDQSGIVSIVVTMIIMIVLTLIVTGFAQLARREQRESLDRQLSTQASYAAETGINDARRAIAQGFSDDKDSCGPITGNPYGLNSNSVDGSTIQYSCLLIKQKLEKLLYQNVNDSASTIVPLISIDAATGAANPISKLNVTWKPKDNVVVRGHAPASGPPLRFPAQGSWSPNLGVLRLDIVTIPNLPGILNTYYLDNNVRTVFLYPVSSGGANTIDVSNISAYPGVNITCSTVCNTVITNIPSSSIHYIRMKSIYKPSEVSICHDLCSGGTTRFVKAQAEIDSTGKANDVVKRIKVRVNDVSSTANNKKPPEFAFDSAENLCKQLTVVPGNTNTTAACPLP